MFCCTKIPRQDTSTKKRTGRQRQAGARAWRPVPWWLAMPCCLHLGRCTVTGSASLRAVGLSLSPFDQCTCRATCNTAHVPCNLQHNAHLACNTAQAAAVRGRRVMAVASQSQKPYISWQSVELPPAHAHTHTHTHKHTTTTTTTICRFPSLVYGRGLHRPAACAAHLQRTTAGATWAANHCSYQPSDVTLLAACMRDVTLRSHSTDVYTEISQPKRAVAVAE